MMIIFKMIETIQIMIMIICFCLKNHNNHKNNYDNSIMNIMRHNPYVKS